MAKAGTVLFDKLDIISTGDQGPAAQIYVGGNGIGGARILNSESPGLAIDSRSDDANVATQIDITMRNTVPNQHAGRAIGGVFLTNPTKVNFHAAVREPHTGWTEFHHIPANQWQDLGKILRSWNFAAGKIPDTAQDSRRYIKQAIADVIEPCCKSKQFSRFRIASDGHTTAGASVDAMDDARIVSAVARIFAFDANHLACRQSDRLSCSHAIAARCNNFAVAGHGPKFAADKFHRCFDLSSRSRRCQDVQDVGASESFCNAERSFAAAVPR